MNQRTKKTYDLLELNNMSINSEEDFNIYQKKKEEILKGCFMWDVGE